MGHPTVLVDRWPVPGGELYYEVRGRGPVLVMVHGGGGSAGSFGAAPGLLAERFTVLTYSRRPGPVQTQVDDVHRLIAAVAGGPVLAMGSSAGAIVLLELMSRYPDDVVRAVLHEPPVPAALVPGAAQTLAFFEDVEATRVREGPYAALLKFLEGNGFLDALLWAQQLGETPPGMTEMLDGMAEVVRYRPDVDALRAVADRLVFAGGAAEPASIPFRASASLGAAVGAPFVLFPGNHYGYAADPEAFATRLAGVLAG